MSKMAKYHWPMALTIIEGDSHFEMLPGKKQLAHKD
jgi:hypothetical protein